MKKTPKSPAPPPSPDQIAEMASRGEDVSAFFTNRFTAVRPVRRVRHDFGARNLLAQQRAVLRRRSPGLPGTLRFESAASARSLKPGPPALQLPGRRCPHRRQRGLSVTTALTAIDRLPS
jgi:hypothetical protein